MRPNLPESIAALRGVLATAAAHADAIEALHDLEKDAAPKGAGEPSPTTGEGARDAQ